MVKAKEPFSTSDAFSDVYLAASSAFADWLDYSLRLANSGPDMLTSMKLNDAKPNGLYAFDPSQLAMSMMSATVDTQRAFVRAAFESMRVGAAMRSMNFVPGPFGLTGFFAATSPADAAPTQSPPPAPKPKPASAKAKPKAAAAPTAETKPNTAPAAPKKRKSSSSAMDDLTRIKGIGPKLSQSLRDMGIRTFAQIADLTPEEIDSINARLRFKGRVEREQWIEQARSLLS